MMKILYISSGHRRIYEFFDRSIIRSFRKLSIQFAIHHPAAPISSLADTLRQFHPDFVLAMLGDKISFDVLKWIKKSNLPSVLWLTEDPYYLKKTIRYAHFFDFLFTIDRFSVEWYQKQGIKNVYYLPLGTDITVFRPKPVDSSFKSDLCLIGYPYENRKKLIDLLIKETPYYIQLVGLWKMDVPKRSKHRVSIHQGWISPSAVSCYYNGAFININTLRPIDDPHNETVANIGIRSLNNRTFDIAACSSFQLAERSDDLNEFFTEDEDIASFSSIEEAVEKIDHYMPLAMDRERISKNGHSKVVMRDTFENRVKQILQTINIQAD